MSTIKCGGCGQTNSEYLKISADGLYVKCSYCNTTTPLFNEKEANDTLLLKKRYNNAFHLLQIKQYDMAKKAFFQLCNDDPLNADSWIGFARSASCDFTVDSLQVKDAFDTVAEITRKFDTCNTIIITYKKRIEKSRQLRLQNGKIEKLQNENIILLENKRKAIEQISKCEQEVADLSKNSISLKRKFSSAVRTCIFLLFLGFVSMALAVECIIKLFFPNIVSAWFIESILTKFFGWVVHYSNGELNPAVFLFFISMLAIFVLFPIYSYYVRKKGEAQHNFEQTKKLIDTSTQQIQQTKKKVNDWELAFTQNANLQQEIQTTTKALSAEDDMLYNKLKELLLDLKSKPTK